MDRPIQDDLVRLRPRLGTNWTSQDRTVLAANTDGFLDASADIGLFVHETRVLSRLRWTIDGAQPYPVALSNVTQQSWLGYYICLLPGMDPELDLGSGGVESASQHTLELRLSRLVRGGLHEHVDLENFTQRPTRFVLALELAADFADQAERKTMPRRELRIRRRWRASPVPELVFDCRAEHAIEVEGHPALSAIRRGLTVRIEASGSTPRRERGRLAFDIELRPRQRWHACVQYVPYIEGQVLEPLYVCSDLESEPVSDTGECDARRKLFLQESTRLTSKQTRLAPVVMSTLERARLDLAALRLPDLDRGERSWTFAAGLPIYVALFGRDTLTAAWQAALLGPEMMHGSLTVLAELQGKVRDDWRDEEPGKMLHEAHTGPLAALGENPRSRYYGSATTSGFYAVGVAELWHWTGDKDLVRPFIEPALDALKWLDGSALREGFYEYRSRSSQGNKHQGWKDSGDAIVYPDGSQVEPPIATCEEQAFVYIAKLHLSEVLWWLDEKSLAKRLFDEAKELKARFHEAFWMEDEGIYALGLDSSREPIRSVASNAGHCLAAGIAERDIAERLAQRLLAPDLFSGWGVRTLSADHPAYNPYSYHRGSVWPVEQGSFALGFMRYGLQTELEKLCRSQFEAARLFEYHRLPEVFSGHARDGAHPFPALYPRANSPQAWSASAAFVLVQSMLGLYPYAPLHMLLVDPHLPDWLPEITLEGLRVGKATATLRFFRDGETSDWRVVEQEGPLHVLRQPSPWSLTAGFGERLKDALASLLPGR
jgi:glycogen debranching enzyme